MAKKQSKCNVYVKQVFAFPYVAFNCKANDCRLVMNSSQSNNSRRRDEAMGNAMDDFNFDRLSLVFLLQQ